MLKFKPTFRIGVPTHQRPRDLARFLEALAPQLRGRTNVRLVIVNDGSHDGAYEAAIAPYRDLLEYRINPVATGVGPARQKAFDDATEDYLVTTDDDCISPSHWLEWLEAMAAARPEVDIFVGEVTPVWTEKPGFLAQLLAIPTSYPAPVFTREGLLTAVGANSAFKRELFEKAGGYNPELAGAADDCSITQRILKAGGTYHYAPAWVMGHKAENTLRQLIRRPYAYGFGNSQYMMLESDWALAEVSSGSDIAESIRAVRRAMVNVSKLSRQAGLHPVKRAIFSLLTAVSTVQYERGWRKGVRLYSARYGVTRPDRPPLTKRYMRFDEDQAVQSG